MKLQNISPRKFTLLFSTILTVSISTVTYAELSLPEAINQQLSPFAPNNPNKVQCGALLGADKAEKVLTGGLKEFCSEQLTIPQGATSTAQGPAMGNADGQATHFRTDYQTAGSEQRLSSHWSFFSSIEQTNADQTITPLADAVTSNQQRLNAGFNYLFSSSNQLGVLFHRTSSQGDYDAGGDFSDEGYGFSALADFALGEEGFLQLSLAKETASTERNRLAAFTILSGDDEVISIKGTPKSDFNYGETQASALLGNSWMLASIKLTPTLGVNWRRNNYGTHSETGDSGLEITTYNDTIKSLQAIAGVQASWAVPLNLGVWAPQVGADYIREFENKSRVLEVSFTGDSRAKHFSYNTQGGDNSYTILSIGSVFYDEEWLAIIR